MKREIIFELIDSIEYLEEEKDTLKLFMNENHEPYVGYIDILTDKVDNLNSAYNSFKEALKH